MKKLIGILSLVLFCSFQLFAQNTCPGITFTTQEEIDNFQANYPDCTEISGSVEINGEDISNLNGLGAITSISGALIIGDIVNYYYSNYFLYSLAGLEELTTIGGYLYIGRNQFLNSLDGLENLSSVGGELTIEENDNLANIAALGNLLSIGGSLEISGNDDLASIAALENLSSISGNLSIEWNSDLVNLGGLEGISSIGGDIEIRSNDALTNVDGIGNIDENSIENLHISGNDLLSSCDVQSICDYLVSPNGLVTIHSNAPGCSSAGEIASACGFVMPCLPLGHYHFTSQSNIDNFQIHFPGCTDLAGDVYISGNDITNVNGLNTVLSIEGNLRISHSEGLTSLVGLDNLVSVGGYLRILKNDSLTSLTGLENLNSVGNKLMIWNNDALADLISLENLTFVDGEVNVSDNGALQSLSGLDNIENASINKIHVTNNQSLFSCHVQFICDYLVVPNGIVEIQNNAPGCNSMEEVEEACEYITGMKESEPTTISIYPNPTDNGHITITLGNLHNLHLTCFNTFGQQVYQQEITGTKTVIDVSTWPPGIYLAVVYENEKPSGKTKFIVR